jgi:hypothetical protein
MGKLHLCADGWTFPNVISFVGLTVHWAAANGHIKSTILDFVKYVTALYYFHHATNIIHRASKGHMCVYLAARTSECLHEYGIQDKVSINGIYPPSRHHTQFR